MDQWWLNLQNRSNITGLPYSHASVALTRWAVFHVVLLNVTLGFFFFFFLWIPDVLLWNYSSVFSKPCVLIWRISGYKRVFSWAPSFHGQSEMSSLLSVSVLPMFVHDCSHICRRHSATKRVLRRVPVEPPLAQPGGRALDPDLFKWSSLYHNRLRAAAALD